MKKRFSNGYILVFIALLICITGGALVSPDHCPDERGGRMLLSNWIYNTGTLPNGFERETINPGWEFSYALRPYLSSIIAAMFMKAASLFSKSQDVLIAASRLGSCCSIALCCFYALKLGHILFKHYFSAILFTLIVSFLPQVQYLGMYQNNDSLALAATAMILFYLAEGYQNNWEIRSCLGLAIAFSVGLLSYYSIYGWILAGFIWFAAAIIRSGIPDKKNFLFKRAALIICTCALLAGWFFIRNAILHNGDFFGLKSEAVSRTLAAEQGYDVRYSYNSFHDKGYSAIDFLLYNDFEFLRWTVLSFIGVFDYMTVYLPANYYKFYFCFFIFFIMLYLAVILNYKPSKRDIWFLSMLIAAGFITFLSHFYQSYYRDYQPQGRYVITIIFLLAYMASYSMDKISSFISDHSGNSASVIMHTTGKIAAFFGYCLFLLLSLYYALPKITV